MVNPKKIAVLIPCLNEEKTIAKVTKDFKKAIPEATIYVFDNCSTDLTQEKAEAAGATVIFSPIPGKGNVIRHMFNVIDADIYIMADGDDTYPATYAPELIKELETKNADTVVGTRLDEHTDDSFRKFHRFGNLLITKIISLLFKTKITDVLSGYRVFNRRFVKSIPIRSSGYEIETELTIQAISKGFRIYEVPTTYKNRPEGSISKLNTFSDGFLILKTIAIIFKDYKPLSFFGTIAFLMAILSICSGLPPVLDYVKTNYVSHVPLAILASGLGILSILFLAIGLILDTIRKYQKENFILFEKIISQRK